MTIDAKIGTISYSYTEAEKAQLKIQEAYNHCIASRDSEGSRAAMNLLELAEILSLRLVSGREQEEFKKEFTHD